MTPPTTPRFTRQLGRPGLVLFFTALLFLSLGFWLHCLLGTPCMTPWVHGVFVVVICAGLWLSLVSWRRLEGELQGAAQKLESQRNLLEGVIDGVHDVLAIQFPDYTIERYNKAGYAMLGLTPEEVAGKKCYELHGNTAVCDHCATRLALLSKQRERQERYIPEKNVHLECFSTPILNEAGEVVRIVEHVRDVTESKRQELRVRNERDFLFRLFHSMDQYIIVDSLDRRIEFMNQKALNAFGDLVGAVCFEQLGKANRCVRCPIDELVQGGADTVNYSVEAFGRILEGTATLLANADGSCSVLEVLVDVTDRRLMEDALRESESRLSRIADTLRDGLIMMDPQGNICLWNPAAEQLLGYRAEDVLGHSLHTLLAPARYRQAFYDAFPHFQNTGQGRAIDQTIELEVLHRNGTEISVELSLASLQLNDGWHALGTIRDITERKRASEQLVAYTKELELRGLELDALYRMLNQEMDNARYVHRRLLQAHIPEIPGMSVSAAYSAATYIGGDFYQVIRKGNKLVIYLSDVTGHGLDATMFSLFVKNTIGTYVGLTSEADLTVDSILAYLDEQVRQEDYPSEYAVAIFMLVIDIQTKTASYSAAGFQNAPILVTKQGQMEFLVSPGLPISRDVPVELMDFDDQQIVFPDDAFLFLSTDGLYEQSGKSATYEERLVALLQQCSGLSEKAIIDLVQKDFQEFCQEADQTDDVTFVVLSTGKSVPCTVPSSYDSLEKVSEAARMFFGDHPNCEGIVMAVWELVTNAIEHGNRFDPQKVVRVLFSPQSVMVEDEGDGFDWRTLEGKELDLESPCERGRGIAMVKLLVGDIVFNQAGNRVSLLLGSD